VTALVLLELAVARGSLSFTLSVLVHLQKSSLILDQRALRSPKRALYSVKRALYPTKRALYSIKTHTIAAEELPLFGSTCDQVSQKNPVFRQKSPVSYQKSPIFHQNTYYHCRRALSFWVNVRSGSLSFVHTRLF